MQIFYCLLLSFLFSSTLHGQSKQSINGSLENFIITTLTDWDVMGVSIAVVTKDSILYSNGFGIKDISTKETVSSQTAYSTASLAKPLIALSVCLLYSDSLIDINKPIKEYIPNLQFKDSYLTNNLTVRDLLLHRSGFARHEELWHLSTESREALVNKYYKLTPERPIRDVFQYSEMSYHLLAYLVDQVTGISWEQYVSREIFAPLNFKNSSFKAEGLINSSNHSQPFIKRLDTVQQTPIREIGVSGGFNSTVKDLSSLLQLFLNNGKFNDNQLIRQSIVLEMLEPSIVIPGYKSRNGLNASYGYGWIVDNYRDNLVIEHNGQTEGYSGWISFFPNSNIGFVILSNNDYSPFSTIIKQAFFDYYLNLLPIDYNSEYLKKDSN